MSGDQKWNDDANIVLGHSKSGVGVGEMISAALGVGRVADAWIERVRTAHVLMSAMTPADGDRIVRAALAMRLGTMVLEAQECVGSAEFFSAAEFLDPNGCRLDPPEAGVRDGYEIPRLLAQLANVADGIAAG